MQAFNKDELHTSYMDRCVCVCVCVCIHVCVQSLSHVRLFATNSLLMDCSTPGSSVHGILQARKLEWVAFPSPGNLPNSGVEPTTPASPALTGRFSLLCHLGSPHICATLGFFFYVYIKT